MDWVKVKQTCRQGHQLGVTQIVYKAELQIVWSGDQAHPHHPAAGPSTDLITTRDYSTTQVCTASSHHSTVETRTLLLGI